MNNYETIFIMKSDMTKEQRKETVEKIKNYISNNGNIVNENDMGIRKLAYEVKKYTSGDYYIIEFECNPEVITELERLYRITDEILRFIVVRKED